MLPVTTLCIFQVLAAFPNNSCMLGWSDFEEEENTTLLMLCQIVVGPQIQNVMP